ncbi:unnamed protein product [Lasius platythorax]|uniref:Uncharacterized protein n=1 Tax=Lasius platythorax TaxID=488582 RepID=A0AAV2NNI3_9HYME
MQILISHRGIFWPLGASGRLTANPICRTTLKKLIAGGMSILMVTTIDVLATNERTNERTSFLDPERSSDQRARALINFRPNKVLDSQPQIQFVDRQFSAAIYAMNFVKDIGYEGKMRARFNLAIFIENRAFFHQLFVGYQCRLSAPQDATK